MAYPDLAERVGQVRGLIASHQERRGWTHPVTIVAVTKGHEPEAVRAAFAAGLTAIGENRVQEALAKQEVLRDCPVEWHLIGTLQRNKAKHAVGRFALIHSVDRLDLAVELNRRASGTQDILVQVNCSAEPQKGGVEPAELPALLDGIRPLEHLRMRGLMTMAELTEDPERQRGPFRLLRELRDQAAQRSGSLPELSMGMSADYLVAVEEGATMVRLGTLLFGARAV
jgi:PLP dependent protein